MDIYIYNNGSCEAKEFIEGSDFGFNADGQVMANEFIEGNSVVYIGSTMEFSELIEN